MDRTAPKVLDDRGNLSLHTQQGAVVEFAFSDVNGQPLDMTARTVYLEVSNSTRLALTAGSTSEKMLLTIPQGYFNAYVNRAVPFVILDETDTQHELLWEGQLTVRGWV